MIELYTRLTRCCSSENQFNKVHIALENRMTPLEAAELCAALRGSRSARLPSRARRGPVRLALRLFRPFRRRHAATRPETDAAPSTHSKAWISKLWKKMALAGGQPAAFVRRRLHHGVSRFEGQGRRDRKTLLICFSGNAHRVMMPWPVFLQHIDVKRADVVYLRTVKNRGYRSGIRGLADDLAESIDALERLVECRTYRKVSVMGTSGGGLPAILAALRLGADAVLAAGPNSPADERWTELSDGRGGAELFRRFAGAQVRLPDIHLVYGAFAKKDKESARAIASCVPVKSVTKVPETGHAALFPLVERGKFRKLLRRTVLA
jgi:hypothetical protein